MAAGLSYVADRQFERSTGRLTGKVVDEAGVALSTLITLTATLYDRDSGTIINGRNDQDILGVNGGSVDGSGNFTLKLSAADNVIVNTENAYETHHLLLKWTYNNGQPGNGRNHILVAIPVQNLPTVTA